MESWRRRRVEIKTMTVPNRHLDLINGHLIIVITSDTRWLAAGSVEILVPGARSGSMDHWTTLGPPTSLAPPATSHPPHPGSKGIMRTPQLCGGQETTSY